MNKINIISQITILIILLNSFVSANFAIGFPHKISLEPGETYKGFISIQNVLGETKDTTIDIKVEQGSDFITFPEGSKVEIKEDEVIDFPVEITIHKNIKENSQSIQVLFSPEKKTSGDGTVGLSLSLRKIFNIDVIKPEKTGNFLIFFLIALVVVIIILATVIIRRMRKSKEFNSQNVNQQV
jgi:hypothetical protein